MLMTFSSSLRRSITYDDMMGDLLQAELKRTGLSFVAAAVVDV